MHNHDYCLPYVIKIKQSMNMRTTEEKLQCQLEHIPQTPLRDHPFTETLIDLKMFPLPSPQKRLSCVERVVDYRASPEHKSGNSINLFLLYHPIHLNATTSLSVFTKDNFPWHYQRRHNVKIPHCSTCFQYYKTNWSKFPHTQTSHLTT